MAASRLGKVLSRLELFQDLLDLLPGARTDRSRCVRPHEHDDLADAHTLRTQSGGIGVHWRESSGQNRDKQFRDRARAVAAYHKAIADKQAEGYREQYARTVVIAESPNTPKKPGKRKSR